MKCKKAKWDLRERDRLRRRSELLSELEEKLLQGKEEELSAIKVRAAAGELGQVAVEEETAAVEKESQLKVNELRNVFAISDPANLTKRV